ncbi:MAG: response regulator [Candidatus Taylorbacteria bacterium]|nr:response regulator [Candidatus Taylorbacteria bacterium]
MQNKKVVLIAEDEATLRGAIKDELTREGISVIEAKNGEEGLRIALSEHPDLIMIDILMPKMDGLAMLKKLREDPWGKNVDFIILTNVSDFDEISRAMKVSEVKDHESFEYLIKSDVKIEDVVEKVKKKLGI